MVYHAISSTGDNGPIIRERHELGLEDVVRVP